MYALNYVENDVLNQDPVELVRLLYSKAIEKLIRGKAHLEAGRVAERSEALGRAMEIVLELQGSLDVEKGGEIAKNLALLYDYIQERLSLANARQLGEPIEEAIQLLSTLSEGWRACRLDLALEEAPPPSEAGAETEAGRAWTL